MEERIELFEAHVGGHLQQTLPEENPGKVGDGHPDKSEHAPCSPLPELDQLVSAERLLKIIWAPDSRPSLQWLRKETKRRMVPYIRRGRLIFYRPRSVIQWYNQRESRPASMK